MTNRLICLAAACGNARSYVGSFRLPFCSRCWAALTELKRSKVMTIAGMSVIEPDSRRLSGAIILECKRYLMTCNEERKHANG